MKQAIAALLLVMCVNSVSAQGIPNGNEIPTCWDLLKSESGSAAEDTYMNFMYNITDLLVKNAGKLECRPVDYTLVTREKAKDLATWVVRDMCSRRSPYYRLSYIAIEMFNTNKYGASLGNGIWDECLY